MIKKVIALSALCVAIAANAAFAGATPQAYQLPDFTQLAEKQGPAVVNISITQVVQGNGSPFAGMPNDEALAELFRRFGIPMPGVPGGSQQEEYKTQSLGSGFIISSDGYIMTNAHVIRNASEVVVKLNDKREFTAKIIGADSRTDVALLKIEATGLPKVNIGDPNQLKVGEWVVAIGSPFGLESTLTAGVVSAKGRALPQENFVPFIQTDVAINPGNSGGPLFNLNGEVVGINSQIYSRSGGFMGVSFAIPIDDAMNVFRQIRDNGVVSRGWLGVLIQEVSRDLAESFGLKRPRGALIAEVMDGSPAQKAGLQSGDIVLAYDGDEVQLSSDLPPMVGRTPIGETARLTVLRGGKEISLDVEIGALPEEGRASTEPASGSRDGSSADALGLVVEQLAGEVV